MTHAGGYRPFSRHGLGSCASPIQVKLLNPEKETDSEYFKHKSNHGDPINSIICQHNIFRKHHMKQRPNFWSRPFSRAKRTI